jgi:hypothetical protein
MNGPKLFGILWSCAQYQSPSFIIIRIFVQHAQRMSVFAQREKDSFIWVQFGSKKYQLPKWLLSIRVRFPFSFLFR